MKRVLVFGDLALDVHSFIPDGTRLSRFDDGEDVTWPADHVITLGGTAFHFAAAISECRAGVPALVASVGNDPLGSGIVSELEGRGFETQGVQQVHTLPTALVYVAYGHGRGRIMTQPTGTASGCLTQAWVQSYLQQVGGSPVGLLWISGFCLKDKDAPRFEAVIAAAAWARRRDVPIVVDMVPHAFRECVGDQHTVEELIGPVDGLVVELETARQFNCGVGDGPVDSHLLGKCADALSENRRLVLVQHRTSVSTYEQVAVGPRGNRATLKVDMGSASPRGLGDRMAVEGMVALKLLP